MFITDVVVRNPWEGVNLLPFIEIDLLKSTIAAHCPPEVLTAAERERNRVGMVYCYKYDATCVDEVESPGAHFGIPDIGESRTSIKLIDEDLGQPKYVFEPTILPGTILPYPGFPSLNVIPIRSVELVPIGLNCFGTASKYPTMVLTMHEMPALPPLEELAQSVLGKSIFVNWPMMHEARVVAVSDATKEVRQSVKGKIKVTKWPELAASRWEKESELMTQVYHNGNGIPGAGGIQINEVKVRLRVVPLQGMKTIPSTGATKKVFGTEEADVPIQLALWQAPVQDPRFVERGPVSLSDRFPTGRSVVLTKGAHRGCRGVVVGVIDQKSVGVRVATYPPEPSFGLAAARALENTYRYMSTVDAAKKLRIHPGLIGKVMGKLQVVQGRYDLGLNLKSADGSCVVGYTRKLVDKSSNKTSEAWAAGDSVLVIGSRQEGSDEEDDERIKWEYSKKAIEAVEDYRNKFPMLFAGLQKQPNVLKYDVKDLLGPGGESLLPTIREWLDNHESAKLPRSPVSTNSLPVEASNAIQIAADARNAAAKKQGYPKDVMLKIPGSALYAEGSTGATGVITAKDLNNDASPALGDRIINLCADGIPFGARGTVIGIHEAATTGSVEVVMDEEFIGGTSLQGHCANFRGKLCLWSQLLRVEAANTVETQKPNKKKEIAEKPVKSKTILSRGDASNDRAKQQITLTTRPQSMTPPRKEASSRTERPSSRTNSSGRSGRQGAWREAKGPAEKGIGFRHTKNNGLYRWKRSLQSAQTTNHAATGESAANLKRILGVNTPGPPVASNAPPPSSGKATVLLKSVLGIDGDTQMQPTAPPPPPQPTALPPQLQTILQPAPATSSIGVTSNATGHLKNLLGVSNSPTILPSPPQEMPPATAADKLLARLNAKLPIGNAMPSATEQSDPFNFSYVEEGAVAPPPPSALPTPKFGAP